MNTGTTNRNTLLQQYRDGLEQADKHWNEYLETKSDQAFSNYLVANRSLSPIYLELVGTGMTLDEIRNEIGKL